MSDNAKKCHLCGSELTSDSYCSFCEIDTENGFPSFKDHVLDRVKTEAESSRVNLEKFKSFPINSNNSNNLKPEKAPEIPFGASSLRFGYAQSNEIVIPLAQVSGRHAEIASVGNRFVLKDLGSTNGVYINSQRITRAYVKVGDIIGLGSYQFPLTLPIIERLSDNANRNTQALPAVNRKGVFVLVGRDPECDISLDIPQVSRQHARFKWNGQRWEIEDLGTINGTYVNNRSQKITKSILSENDKVFFGSYRFSIDRLQRFVGLPTIGATEELSIPDEKSIITIGRDPKNDIVIDSLQVSRQHAKIRKTSNGFILEDLGSANGTYVDGKLVNSTSIKPGQKLSFGSYGLIFDKSGSFIRHRPNDIAVQVDSISISASDRKILDRVSFTTYPTELVGILGPSGSGKTTLLMSIIGELSPSSGTTRLNGLELSKNASRFRGSIGYLPQDDIIHPNLTVYESLYHAAKLRLPDTSKKEVKTRIEKVLQNLELENIADVRIGSPERKGISGGQRKRVNLAMELLTEPYLLCLDEPTSGLASEDALNVMRVLKKLSTDGRTILLTIHQPSLRVYRELDNVLYLSDGKLVYYGPSYPDSIQFFQPEIDLYSPEGAAIMADPGSCMTPIVDASKKGETAALEKTYSESRFHSEYIENRALQNVTDNNNSKKTRLHSFQQFKTLAHRYFRTKLRDKVGMAILLLQAPLIGILLDFVFASEKGVFARLSDVPFALFFLVISAIWFGCSNAAREIVAERTIFRRERMVGLSIPAYIASKYVVLGGISLIQTAMLIGVTYFFIDIQGNVFFTLLTLWLASLSGIGMGLLLSSAVRSIEGATASVPLLLIPQIILGGAIMPLDRMREPVKIISYSVVSRYGFEANLHIEDRNNAYEIPVKDLPKPIAPGLPSLPPPPHPIDRFIGDNTTSIVTNHAILVAFNVGLFLMTWISIFIFSKRRRRL